MLNYPCTHLDMVRPGIALYGYYPAEELKGLDGPGLEPVMTVKSRISAVRALPKGTYVSYGRTAGWNGTPCWRWCPSATGTATPEACPTG